MVGVDLLFVGSHLDKVPPELIHKLLNANSVDEIQPEIEALMKEHLNIDVKALEETKLQVL